MFNSPSDLVKQDSQECHVSRRRRVRQVIMRQVVQRDAMLLPPTSHVPPHPTGHELSGMRH